MKSLKREVGEYIAENYSPLAWWSPKQLLRWIQWAIVQGRLVVVRDDDNAIVGVTVFRSLYAWTETKIYGLEQDEDGEVAYIDLAISTKGKPVLQALLHGMLQRLGPRPLIAFNQFKYQDRLKVYRMSKFKKVVYGVEKRSGAKSLEYSQS